LAERANISSQHISHIETGRAQVSLPTLVAISNALQTDCNTLLGETLTAAQNTLYRQSLKKFSRQWTQRNFSFAMKFAD